MKPTAIVISFSDLSRDARLQRQINALKDSFTLTVAALEPYGGLPKGVHFLQIRPSWNPLFKLLRFVCGVLHLWDVAYSSVATVRAARTVLKHVRANVWLANDILTLPIALELAQGNPVWLDAHEFAPLEREDSLFWRLLHQGLNRYLCDNYVAKAIGMSTVSRGLAAAYSKWARRAPVVVWNSSLENAPNVVFKSRTSGPLNLVHHGAADPSRKLEVLIEAMHLLSGAGSSDYELHFHLVAPNKRAVRYLNELKARARLMGKIRFHDAVPPRDLPRKLAGYDVGLIGIPPVNFNFRFCMPNKLFDFMGAGIPVITGPLDELGAFVTRHQIGWVATDFDAASLAKVISGLSMEGLEAARRNILGIRETFGAESVYGELRRELLTVVSESSPASG